MSATPMTTVTIGNVAFGNDKPLSIIAGPCAMESREHALEMASALKEITAKLGIGPRQLSRLFQRHVGASPVQMAKTVRIQRAKRLLNSTDLPITEIAFRAGFSSLRRFNATFRELYGRPPSALPRLSSRT